MSTHREEPSMLSAVEDVQAALEAALRGRLVVQAWLGYAQVLFCGFGAGPPMHAPPDADHPQPPFELQTNYAAWTVLKDGTRVGSSDDDDPVASMAVEMLVGNRVAEWALDGEDQLLTISLAGGLTLVIAPMKDQDTLDEEAWSLRMDDGLYWTLGCNGTVRQHRDHLDPSSRARP